MAIKVITPGKLPEKKPPQKFVITCERCSAVIHIDETDWIKHAYDFREPQDFGSEDHVLCPTAGCGTKLTRYGKTTKELVERLTRR